jgi:hypothetical protein
LRFANTRDPGKLVIAEKVPGLSKLSPVAAMAADGLKSEKIRID